MDMNWIVIIVVSIIAFAMAPLWFGALFGKQWMKIHGWENLSKADLKKQEEGMGKLLALEAINTLIMVAVLAFLLDNLSGYSPFLIAGLIWVAFLLPSSISSVIWGADKKKWHCTKIAILGGFSFVVVMVTSYLLTTFG